MLAAIYTAIVLYCIVTVGILWAYSRTRLYPLYVLKTIWIGFTIVCFLWIFAMAWADPGPKHGGKQMEFLVNPAGPLAALGDFPVLFRQMYFSKPWWLFFAFALLLLWRGLSENRLADDDAAAKCRLRRSFLAASAILMFGLTIYLDRPASETAPGYLPYTGALLLAICGITWACIPLDWRRKHSLKFMLTAALVAAVPLVAAFGRFDWSRYTYGLQNYSFAWKTARMGDYVTNSLFVSVLTVGITTVLASMAAYALSRLEFRGRSAVLYGFLGALVIPAQLYIVPLFLMIQGWEFTIGGIHFNFMDSRLGLSLIYAAGGLPFTIFLLTGFYRTLPTELGESAAIDGCSEWRVFTDIYFPLATPGIATAAIFQFLRVWNEYQFALVFLTNDKLKTLPVGLYNLSVSQQYAANWPALFAGVTILCLPTFIIFVILQERIVAGLTLGAVKG